LTRGSFKKRVSRKTGIDLDVADEVTFLEDAFYDGIIDFLLNTHCYIDIGDMTLTSGVAEYRTDDSILAAINHRETSQGQMYGLFPEVTSMAEVMRLQASTQSGSPVQKVAIEGNLMVVWPTPSSADVIRWLYVPRPAKMTDDTQDSSVAAWGGIPAEYDQALEYWGLWQAAEYNDKETGSRGRGSTTPGSGYRDYYDAMVARARKNSRRRGQRGLNPPQIGYPGSRKSGPIRNDTFPEY
jgi:hypothetical protein